MHKVILAATIVVGLAVSLTGCTSSSYDETAPDTTTVEAPSNYTHVPELDFYQANVKYEVFYACIGTTAAYIGVGPYRDLSAVGLWSIDNSPECVG